MFVLIVSVPLGWLASERNVVHERRLLINQFEHSGGYVSYGEYRPDFSPNDRMGVYQYIDGQRLYASVGVATRCPISFFRRYFGDRDVLILFRPQMSGDDKKNLSRSFPEAYILSLDDFTMKDTELGDYWAAERKATAKTTQASNTN